MPAAETSREQREEEDQRLFVWLHPMLIRGTQALTARPRVVPGRIGPGPQPEEPAAVIRADAPYSGTRTVALGRGGRCPLRSRSE